MASLKELIDATNAQLEQRRPFTDLVYRDEPIVMTATQMKSFTPPRYRQMRELAQSPTGRTMSPAHRFYTQAKFMEDFTDDCPDRGTFVCYFPTYSQLDLPRLRGYFTWRTQVREGNVRPTSLSFACLYVYELLACIGSSTPEEGLGKLLDFFDAYSRIDDQILRFRQTWVRDFVVYYDLDADRIPQYCSRDFDRHLETLLSSEQSEDEALFAAIDALSTYRLDRSKLWKTHPEETKQAVCAAFRQAVRHYAGTKKTYCQRLYGMGGEQPYVLFSSAVFYDHLHRADGEYRFSSVQAYRKANGRWTQVQAYVSPRPSKELGELVREVDRTLRTRLELPPLTPPDKQAKWLRKALEEIADRVIRPPAPAPMSFDLSKLAGIRQAAAVTRDKLLTEEEMDTPPLFQTGPAPVPVSPPPVPPAPAAAGDLPAGPAAPQLAGSGSEPASPLDPVETEFVRRLLAGQDGDAWLKENKRMLSMVVDAINEKLWDRFGDTALEFVGDTPAPVEEYRQELEGVIAP